MSIWQTNIEKTIQNTLARIPELIAIQISKATTRVRRARAGKRISRTNLDLKDLKLTPPSEDASLENAIPSAVNQQGRPTLIGSLFTSSD